jgi:tRNA(Ile2) C34 agmatinyltransferase TiaS
MNLSPDWQQREAVCVSCYDYTVMFGNEDEGWTCRSCGTEYDESELVLRYDDEGDYDDDE